MEKDIIKTTRSASEITYEHPEQDYIEFIYCLWRGILPESKYFMNGRISKSMRKEALDFFYNDPLFHRIYSLNKDLFKSRNE